jgi:hypothetical protein
MALTRQDVQDILALIAHVLNEQRSQETGISGHVVPGSYHAHDGTVAILIDDTDAAYQLAKALGDTSITIPLAQPRVPLAVHDPNDQYGPRGGEPAVLIPWQGGFIAKLYCDADTDGARGAGPYWSVKAPSGERWLFHRNADGVIDSGVQLTNDGPTNGDGLGGTIVGNQGAFTQAQTASGHKVALNDTQQKITIETAGGLGGANPLSSVFDDTVQKITTAASTTVKTIVDGAGNAISHVVPGGSGGVVALGDLASNLTSGGYGAINNNILATFGSNINQFGLSNLISYAQLLHSVGAITNAQLTAMLAQLVISWITNVVVPAGSQIVKIAA